MAKSSSGTGTGSTATGNENTITASFEKNTMLATKSKEHRELTSAITRCIAACKCSRERWF